MKFVNFQLASCRSDFVITTDGSSRAQRTALSKCLISRLNRISLQSSTPMKVPHQYSSGLPTSSETHRLGCINTIALSKEENIIATASADCSVKLFDFEDQQVIHHFENLHKSNKNALLALTFPKRASWMFVLRPMEGISSQLQRTCLLNSRISSGRRSSRFSTSSMKVKPYKRCCLRFFLELINKIACTPDGKYLVTASNDRSIKVVDIEKKELIYTFENAHDQPVSHFALSSSGVYITSVSEDKSLKIFNCYSKQFITCFENIHAGKMERKSTTNPTFAQILSSKSQFRTMVRLS
mgnify:FL=1